MAAPAQGFSAVEHRLQSLLADARSRSLGQYRPRFERQAASKKNFEPTPATLIIDSQSVKTNYEGEARGFHGGKKVKGRSRQIAVDSQGQIWAVHVHAANLSDTKEGCTLGDDAMRQLPSVKAWNADAGYRGSFVEHMKIRWERPVHISQRIVDGFAVLPRRWVVERTFAWFNGQRRLSKDYEKTTASSRSMIFIAAIARNLRSIMKCF
jgi:putative transposase